MQTIEYEPRVGDDQEDIRCSVEAGAGNTQSDTITVFMHLLASSKGKQRLATLRMRTSLLFCARAHKPTL